MELNIVPDNAEAETPAEPTQPSPAEFVPQNEVMRCIVNNMFGDAIMQNLALVLIGYTMQRNPDLNDPQRFVALDLDTKTWQDYRITAPISLDSFRLDEYTESMDTISDRIAMTLRARWANKKLVAASMTAVVNVKTASYGNPDAEIVAFWIEEK